MDFVVKTQEGSLVQVTDFFKNGNYIDISHNSDYEDGWCIEYNSEKRRDEVFKQLEEWVIGTIQAKLYGNSDLFIKDFGVRAKSLMIFEFPKE